MHARLPVFAVERLAEGGYRLKLDSPAGFLSLKIDASEAALLGVTEEPRESEDGHERPPVIKYPETLEVHLSV